MIPHKINGKLMFLALIGVILYFTSNLILMLSHNESMEEDMKPPAVTKAQAQETALRYAQERLGFKGTDTEIAYQTDAYASGYVAKNRLAKLYKDEFIRTAPLDFWMVIVNNAGSGESFTINVGLEHPDVAGWEKSSALPKERHEKDLTAAMKALKDFGYNPDEWTYAPEEDTKGNVFSFRSNTAKLGEAPVKVTVGIRAGEPVMLKTGYYIPKNYLDYIKPQERLAAWMTGGSLALTAALGITAIVMAIVYGRRVSWVRGIFLSVVVLVLYIVQNVNVTKALLTAQREGGSDAIINILVTGFVVIAAVLTAAGVWFSLISGDQQWRMKGWNPWPRWRDPEFGEEVFYGMGRGYLICLFILGVQQLLFLIASNVFDSFVINDPTQSVYNMKWPWLFPTLAWVAAIMEEAVYRLFGIVLFKRMLRLNVLAVLAPGLIWALGHTGYTIYPSYTRLVEVTVLAFIFGYTFLKFGLITAIFAHAVMDSLLMALALMIGSPTETNIMMGLFYILLPALIGYVIRYLHPRFGDPRRKLRHSGDRPEPRLTP